MQLVCPSCPEKKESQLISIGKSDRGIRLLCPNCGRVFYITSCTLEEAPGEKYHLRGG